MYKIIEQVLLFIYLCMEYPHYQKWLNLGVTHLNKMYESINNTHYNAKVECINK